MNIQSFSIVVPNKSCVNKCPFCVSRMVNSDCYPNLMDINHPHYDINVNEYLKRMKFVAENGCQTLMLTGTSEPQQNKQFLATLALLHKQIGSPFTNIEMQCTGLFLDNRDYLRFLRNFVGVNTIALSINSPVDSENNEILGHGHDNMNVKLEELTALLKEYDFNIRCCFNLNSYFDSFGNTLECMRSMFKWAKQRLHADQVTLRKLYTSEVATSQGLWIEDHKISKQFIATLNWLCKDQKSIGHTVYGAEIKEVEGVSVIYDTDCMGKKPTSDAVKYLILRPNCKLYASWDSPASLVF